MTKAPTPWVDLPFRTRAAIIAAVTSGLYVVVCIVVFLVRLVIAYPEEVMVGSALVNVVIGAVLFARRLWSMTRGD